MGLLRTSPPKMSLEDRIEALRAEVDAAINERAAELKATMPGVPTNVIRNILTRNSDCCCRAWLRIASEA